MVPAVNGDVIKSYVRAKGKPGTAEPVLAVLLPPGLEEAGLAKERHGPWRGAWQSRGEPLPRTLPAPCLGWGNPWHHSVSLAGVVDMWAKKLC